MITGDHRAIAQETARSLGMGDTICTPENLPTLTAGEPIPTTLGRDFGPLLEDSDGFAQVFPEHKVRKGPICAKGSFAHRAAHLRKGFICS